MLEQCRNKFGNLLFEHTIREAQAINDAFMLRDPVVYLKKSSAVAKDYHQLSDEFIERVDKEKGKVGI